MKIRISFFFLQIHAIVLIVAAEAAVLIVTKQFAHVHLVTFF